MGKRDLIAEIVQKRARALKGAGRYAIFTRRWDSLDESYRLIKNHHSGNLTARRELLRHLPVGLVACVESYTRLAIRDLIDSGPPYQASASGLQDTKIDLRTLVGMGSARISVGEFVSHLLPISSLEDIERHISVLVGADFWTEMKKLPRAPAGGPLEPLARYLIEDMQQLFHSRHIICHEMGRKVNLSLANTLNMMQAVLVFTDALESLVRNALGEKPLPAI